jgi:WD40 repeat protein
MGFTAPIIVWDFETGKILHKLELHKVLVQGVAFSCGDEYLATIGGQV